MNIKAHKEVFCTIGLAFNLLIHGSEPDAKLFNKDIVALNELFLLGEIDSNEYDYLLDAIDTTREFITMVFKDMHPRKGVPPQI